MKFVYRHTPPLLNLEQTYKKLGLRQILWVLTKGITLDLPHLVSMLFKAIPPFHQNELLGLAIDLGRPNMITLLASLGADIETEYSLLDTDDFDPTTPLDYALKNENPRVAQALLEAKANASIDQLNQLLFLAIRMREITLLSLVLARGADPTHINNDYYQKTPLMIAASLGNIETLQVLLEDKRVKENLAVLGPLSKQVIRSNFSNSAETLKLLLASGVSSDPNLSRRLLHLAVQQGKTTLIGVLLDAKASNPLENKGATVIQDPKETKTSTPPPSQFFTKPPRKESTKPDDLQKQPKPVEHHDCSLPVFYAPPDIFG